MNNMAFYDFDAHDNFYGMNLLGVNTSDQGNNGENLELHFD